MEAQKGLRSDKHHALIAVHKWMIGRDSERVGRGEIEYVGIRVSPSVLRARERRFEKPFIAKSGAAAVLSDLRLMTARTSPSKPFRLHLASARKTSRGTAVNSVDAPSGSPAL